MNFNVYPVNLTDVTVFLRGAELYSSRQISLPAGESEVVLSNVAGRMNVQSLSISASNGVIVLSSSIRNDYLVDDTLSPKAQEIKDSLEVAQLERETLQIQADVIKEQLAVLAANRKLSQADSSLSAAEVGKMLDLVASRMTAALKQQAQLNLEMTKLDERIGKLEQQLAEEQHKDFQPGGQVVVKFYAPQATSTELDMSYVVPDAGWVPTYDLHVEKFGAPVRMTYKAQLFQNTGIDWNKVNLTLSTGNPSQGAQVPQIYPWYVSVNRYEAKAIAQDYLSADVAEIAVPAEAPSASAMVASQRRAAAPVRSNTLDGYVATNAQGMNTSFDIAIPYTVSTDGKSHMIMVQTANVPAKYQYVVIPRLDADVFLQARITDWKDLNLLPGQTSIYFENSFVGQGRIDFNNIKDGLDVSLGRDKRIVVERVEDKNNHGTAGLFGGSAQRTFAYTINVHNSRDKDIELVVKDQLPVSRDSEVTLQELKLAGAVHNDKIGELAWILNLKAHEQRSVSYSYAVRYPKDADISGL